MKNNLLLRLALILLILPAICVAQSENEPYTINHGPYLQGLTYDGVIVCFTTSHRGFSGVELREKGSGEARLCRTSKDGLFEADNTLNSIHIEGLKPATEYEYRIVSKRMLSFEPYKVTFGEEIATDWYSFSTFDPKAEAVTFVVANDIHDDAKKCADLLDQLPLDEASMVFYNGDIMSHYSRARWPRVSWLPRTTAKGFCVANFSTDTSIKLL